MIDLHIAKITPMVLVDFLGAYEKWQKLPVRYDDAFTNWAQLSPICVRKLAIIGSDSGLSPDRRQAFNWTNAGMLLILTLGTNRAKSKAKFTYFIEETAFKNCV